MRSLCADQRSHRADPSVVVPEQQGAGLRGFPLVLRPGYRARVVAGAVQDRFRKVRHGTVAPAHCPTALATGLSLRPVVHCRRQPFSPRVRLALCRCRNLWARSPTSLRSSGATTNRPCESPPPLPRSATALACRRRACGRPCADLLDVQVQAAVGSRVPQSARHVPPPPPLPHGRHLARLVGRRVHTVSSPIRHHVAPRRRNLGWLLAGCCVVPLVLTRCCCACACCCSHTAAGTTPRPS